MAPGLIPSCTYLSRPYTLKLYARNVSITPNEADLAHSLVERRGVVDQEMVAALCGLAAQFQDQAELSMGELLAKSGYSLAHDISDGDLEEYLRSHPELVNSWLIESRNTRENPAWYIFPPRNGSDWLVTHYPDNTRHTFTDKFEACAFYVRVYVKQLGSQRAATYYGRAPKWNG